MAFEGLLSFFLFGGSGLVGSGFGWIVVGFAGMGVGMVIDFWGRVGVVDMDRLRNTESSLCVGAAITVAATESIAAGLRGSWILEASNQSRSK